MDESNEAPATPLRTVVERTSDRELRVTRTFDAPADILFEAWTTPALFMRWWAPKSMGVPILSCAMDVRTGGSYRLEFGQDASQSFAFFGRYVDVLPGARIVWTNEEGEDDGAVTTVTFEEQGGKTLLTYHDLHPSKEARDEALAGMESGMSEQFAQLDELLASLGAGGTPN